MHRRLSLFILALSLAFVPGDAPAHPMPSSFVFLDIHADGVSAELKLPLNELQLAFGHEVEKDPGNLVSRLGPLLKAYILAHVRPVTKENFRWQVEVRSLYVQPVEQSASGPYQELTAELWLQPPAGSGPRDFVLNYDVIIHQVVTHTALVSIRQDWDAGIDAEHPVEVGVIRLDVPSGTIPPMHITQANGSMWRGFKSMVKLGIHHIADGTDHLLFLLTLLLPAPLLESRGRWKGFGGLRYSLLRLLNVVTAFTLGHSLTLLAGAAGWVHMPGKPVEILIAVSILISAVHALRPLFPGREAYIAGGFGLVHGMAFAGTLSVLNLETGRLALSILGFNLGIELMQLFVIAVTIPWLIMISRTYAYPVIRISGALFSAMAAIVWIIERVSEKTNSYGSIVEKLAGLAPWIILLLASFALISAGWERRKKRTQLLSS